MKNSDRPIYPITNEAGFATRVRNLEPEQAIGLTKLEYFAGLAMQGICINNSGNQYKLAEEIAKIAVETARALLTELENQSK